MNHGRHTTTLALSAIGVLTLAGSALGQNALGDGRKLDNNLNVSTGRVNPRATGVADQIRYNNSVIYGTAPGGKSFQGSIGYRAPDQFGGSVGSDTLYNFQRDSFTSGLAAQGVRGSDALRYQFSLTTGQNVPSFLGTAPVAVPRSGSVTTVNSTSSALRSTSDFVTGQSYRPTLVGVKHDDLGAEYVAKASPLLGVTWVKTGESPLGASSGLPTPMGVPAPVPAIPGIPDATQPVNPSGVAPPNTTAPTSPSNPANPNAPTRGNDAASGAAFTGLETASRGVTNVLDRPNAIDLRVTGVQSEASSSAHNQLMNRFREGFGSAPKPGEDKNEPVTFEMQMERLHRMLDPTAQPEKKPAPGERGPDGMLILPKVKPTENKDQPEPATPRPNAAAPAQKDITGKNIDPSLEALTPDFMKATRKLQEKKVDHYVEPAPAAGPDVSADPAGYRDNMREGEKFLSQGKFFDAEDLFVRAIAASPRDPMARAARLHAQIGAGLYLSAATNLRALFVGHPEMIGARYADNLMPSAQRSKIIVEQLSEQEQKNDSALGREAALLRAYMGYQRGDAAVVTDGLDTFSKRIAPDASGDPDRALLTLVRGAWTTK